MKYAKKMLPILITGMLSCNIYAENINSTVSEPAIESVCKHTALHYATSIEKYNYVKALLDRKEFTLFELNYQCQTAIHIAAELGNISILNLFYSYLGNFEVTNYKGQTPIMIAVENNQHQAILFMIENGVDLDKTDKTGKSVRDYFKENGDYLTQKILKNQENKKIISSFEVSKVNKDNKLNDLNEMISKKEELIIKMQKEGVNPEIINSLKAEIETLRQNIADLEAIIQAQASEIAELKMMRSMSDESLHDSVNNSPIKKKETLNSHIPEAEYKELLDKFKKSDDSDLNQLSDELKLMDILSQPIYKIDKKTDKNK